MASDKDLEYWRERTAKFGEAGIGYGCNPRLIRWDNFLREKGISRLIQIGKGQRVLDVGAGSGYWSIRCAKAGAEVVGIDFNENILKIAQAKAKEAGVKATWIHCSLEDFPVPSEQFDFALSITCLQHLTERKRQEEAIRRILRSLGPGGIFLLLEDTPLRGARITEYMSAYNQRDWIRLVESQGARLLNHTGVSFLRFRGGRFLAPFCVGIDYLLGVLPIFKSLATVTAFAFIATHRDGDP